jgi:hypothetical protein
VPVSGKNDVDFTMKDGNLGFHGISWDFIGFHGISWDFMGFNEASISSEYILYTLWLFNMAMV